MDFWYSTAKAIVGTYISLFIQKIQVDGRENIPSGPKIVVANHALATDAFLLPFIFPEKLYYLVQADVFNLPILGKILALADQIPVVKGRGMEAMEKAKEKLAKGGTIALFPEGKLNDGKQLLRAYTGAARLTLLSGAPVLPVGIYTPPRFARAINAHIHGRPTYGSWQFGGPSFISIGSTWQPPVDTPCEENPYQYAKFVRDMTDEIMGRINYMVDRARTYAATWFPGIQSLP
jgi:1-acyl-sn-glycerol-3-phosphate acyltransferase